MSRDCGFWWRDADEMGASLNQRSLTRAEYHRYRDRYLPENRKTVFVLESPPVSGKYFYDPDGVVTEPLFRAMMKDVLDTDPKTKEEGLGEFAARGFLLEPKLAACGFTVLNRGKEIDFPSTGRQNKFREAVRQILELKPIPK